MGTFTISFDGNSRAAYPPNIPEGANSDPSAPSINDLRFEVSFAGIGGSGGETFSFIGNQELTSSVIVGTYNVTIRVFLRSDNSIYATGAAINNPVTIVSGPNPNIIIQLAPQAAQGNITGRWAGSWDDAIGDQIVLTRGSNEDEIVFDLRSNGTFRMTFMFYYGEPVPPPNPAPAPPGGSGGGGGGGGGGGSAGSGTGLSIARSNVETETLDGTYSVSGTHVAFVVIFEDEREEFSGTVVGNTMYVDGLIESGGDDGPGPAPPPARMAVNIEILDEPTKLHYVVGESIDLTGLVVRVYWADGTITIETDHTSFFTEPYDLSRPGDNRRIVIYHHSNPHASARFSVTVVEP